MHNANRVVTVSILLRALVNVYRVISWPLWALLRRTRKESGWVEIALHGLLEELRAAPESGVRGLLARLRPGPPTVADVRRLAARVARDPSGTGLLLSVGSLRGGFATLASLREVIGEVVASGKRCVVMLPEGATQRELFVASAGSSVVAPPCASVSVLGPAARRSYLAPLLAKLGLSVEVLAQGRYKTAAEALIREQMSEAEREQSLGLVTTLKDELNSALGARLPQGQSAEQLFERALFGADQAKQLGLLDQCFYRDQLDSELGLSERKRPLPPRAYLRRSQPWGLLALRPRPRPALLVLQGPIGDVSSSRSIALKPATAALRQLAQRRDICGVVLYIDSPGGSALVSDLLHREVQRLAERKPVVGWLGNVAASGGYYLAAATNRIVARPCTVTGSIGVISAHLVVGELLSRAGVRNEVVQLTPHADFASLTRPLSERERELLLAESQRCYERFLEIVGWGRNLPRERVAELAEGRVWSGREAQARGLVDTLGGYEAALAELRGLLSGGPVEADFDAPLVIHPSPRRGGALWNARIGSGSGFSEALTLFELAASGAGALAYAASVPRLTL
jgi:protease-4